MALKECNCRLNFHYDGKVERECYKHYQMKEYGINWALCAKDCQGKLRNVKVYEDKNEAERALNEKLD